MAGRLALSSSLKARESDSVGNQTDLGLATRFGLPPQSGHQDLDVFSVPPPAPRQGALPRGRSEF